MVGVYLSLWVRRRLLPAVRGVQVTAVGTGVLGYLGNKGAPPARTPQRFTLHLYHKVHHWAPGWHSRCGCMQKY